SADIQSLSITQNLGKTRNIASSDVEIADAILDWQDNHMKYRNATVDSYAMRWNYIMPGIYHVRNLIPDRTSVDSKIYGLCWDYAAIFNALAEYYGLGVRVTAWKDYMSGVPGGYNGMGTDEYNVLKVKLLLNSLGFSYDEIRNATKETYKHYRAEVRISGNWTSYDGTYPTGAYLVTSNYSEVKWNDYYSTNLAYQ
ncbi:MAG: hypothetical protein WCH76_02315, partial [Candidatus Riflemargulisbacteria bacterium]